MLNFLLNYIESITVLLSLKFALVYENIQIFNLKL